jgi:pilus assembly protein CpaE
MSQDLARTNGMAGESQSRSNRVSVLAFISDPASEQVIREALADVVSNGLDLRRGSIRTAIGAMAKLPTPEALIVDLSGESQPLQALNELSDIVEPGVHILAIGQTDDVDFYRRITRDLGVLEYIFKPITRDAVARHFVPLITHKTFGDEATRGGRVIAITGARGGVGATSIATNLAWYLGVSSKRHTVFVEADLHMGCGALLFGGKTGPGLRTALESPEQIDAEFIELSAEPIADRLHLLASEERLDDPLHYAPGAAARLIEALRVRYNFIILDLPYLPNLFHRELLNFVHHRVIVIDPSLASVRDCLRLLALPNGPWQPQSPTLILNRVGRPGGLTPKQIGEALNAKIDILVPDMPKPLGETNHHGETMVRLGVPFQDMLADLAREIGFVGPRGQFATQEVRAFSLNDLFRRVLPQSG